jgi:hypothetical protein
VFAWFGAERSFRLKELSPAKDKDETLPSYVQATPKSLHLAQPGLRSSHLTRRSLQLEQPLLDFLCARRWRFASETAFPSAAVMFAAVIAACLCNPSRSRQGLKKTCLHGGIDVVLVPEKMYGSQATPMILPHGHGVWNTRGG